MPSLHIPRQLRRVLPVAVAISAATLALASALAAPARASTNLPVNYDFIAGATPPPSPPTRRRRALTTGPAS
jgi:hypothetical protein